MLGAQLRARFPPCVVGAPSNKYSTPNVAVRDLVEDEDIKNSPMSFPAPEVYEDQETYKYLGEQQDRIYGDLWIQVKVN